MGNIKSFILKHPIIIAIITFLLAYFVHTINAGLIGQIYISIEKTLVPIALLLSLLYGYLYKEQLPQKYRLKYSISAALLYAIFNISAIYYFPNAHNSSLLFTASRTPIFCFLIYFLSGIITKRFSKSKTQNIENSLNSKSIAIQRKNFFILWIIIAIKLLLVIFAYFNRNLIKFFPLIFLIAIVVWGIKHEIKSKLDNEANITKED